MQSFRNGSAGEFIITMIIIIAIMWGILSDDTIDEAKELKKHNNSTQSFKARYYSAMKNIEILSNRNSLVEGQLAVCKANQVISKVIAEDSPTTSEAPTSAFSYGSGY